MKRLLVLLLFLFLVLFPQGTQAQTAGSVSCPVPGGKIKTNSYQGARGGHCGGGYGFSCYAKCPTTSRRAKAIDIATEGKDVVLPMINGQEVQWELITKGFDVQGGEGGGLGHTFEAKVGSDTWYLDMLHLTQTSIGQGEKRPSGTVVAKSVIAHVHATIGKNLKGRPSAGSDTDCDEGWLASEFMCDPNAPQPPVTPGGGSSSGGTSSSGGSATGKFCTKVGSPSEPNPCGVSSGGPTGPFPFYCQGDSKYQNSKWQCSLAGYGCGPTSLAMVFSYYGNTITPPEQYEEVQKGYFDCGQGTYLPGMLGGKTWFTNKGYEVGPDIGHGTLNATEAKKYIDEGWLLIGSTNAYKGTGISHIFVIQDVDPQVGTFTMRDPANCGPDGIERIENNVQPIRGSSFITDWFYAYPVRKIGFTPGKKDETTGTATAAGKAFPVSGWNTGVKLHWDVDTGGSDFPPDKPANITQWEGTPVVAVEDSVVEEVNGPDYKGPGGNYVQLKGKASNLSYYYAHLKERSVEQGREVKAGEKIGSIGMTGNAEFAHLHLGIGPSISYGAGAKGGVGDYNAVGLLCGILHKPVNARGDCR